MPSALHQTALLLVDNQRGLLSHPTFYGKGRSTPAYEQNLPALLQGFRSAATATTPTGKGPLIVHVYHISLNPLSPLHSSPGNDFLDIACPRDGEPVISKTVNSSFIGTNLEALLRGRGIRQLYIAGMTTSHCVSTTVRMAANLGVTNYVNEDEGGEGEIEGEVILVEDATAAFGRGGIDAELMHRVEVESLRDEFCRVVTTKEALEEVKGLLEG